MKKKWIVVPKLQNSFADGGAVSSYAFTTKEAAVSWATTEVNTNKQPQYIFEMTESVKTKENPAVVEEIKA